MRLFGLGSKKESRTGQNGGNAMVLSDSGPKRRLTAIQRLKAKARAKEPSLCHSCTALISSKEFRKVQSHSKQSVKHSWDPEDLKGSRSTCTMCAFLIQAMVGNAASDAQEQVLERFWEEGFRLTSDSTDDGEHVGRLFSGEVLFKAGMYYSHMRPFRPESTVYIRMTKALRQYSTTCVTPVRGMISGSVDFGLIRKWMLKCCKSHGGKCNFIRAPEPRVRLKAFQLIDCEERRIIQVPDGTIYRYVALSYVWGGLRDDASDRNINGHMPTIAPKTVEDAMTVTRGIGLRYLWIDRYCVNREDASHQQTQILQMNLVYERAHLTIIAAAGADAHHGLPGVSFVPRNKQPNLRLGNWHFVSLLAPPSRIVGRSKWATRAWTYQEGYFSRRRLIFTEQQISYCCTTHVASEVMPDLSERSINNPILCGFDGLFPQRDGLDWHTIQRDIEQYAGRNLTYDEDAVGAFEGVLNDYRMSCGVEHHMGILLAPGLGAEDRFVAGLGWIAPSVCDRRNVFPSWTWAGWRCRPDLRLQRFDDGQRDRETTLLEEERQPSKVLLEDADGFRVKISSVPRGLQSRFVHIEALVFPTDCRYFHYSSREARTLWGRMVPGGFYASFEGPGHSRVFTPVNLYEEQRMREIRGGYVPAGSERLAVMLQHNQHGSSQVFMLLVESRGTYFERIGHISVFGWDSLVVLTSDENTIEKIRDLQYMFDDTHAYPWRDPRWELMHNHAAPWDDQRWEFINNHLLVCKQKRWIRMG